MVHPDYPQTKLLILKELLESQNNGTNLIKFETLVQKLFEKRSINNKSAILYMLYLVSPMREKENHSLEFVSNGQDLALTQKLLRLPQIKNALSDEIILKDLTFVLQGLDGSFLRYNRAHNFYEFSPQPSNRLIVCFKSKSQEILTLKLSETGFLFRRLNHEILQISYVNTNKSLIRTYLIEYFSREMNRFYGIINSLEGQYLNIKQNFSLKSLFILLAQEHERLKWLNIVWDSIVKSGFVGCQIINVVYQFYFIADPMIRTFFENLMKHMVKPLVNYVRFWMVSGELKDEYNEFFIENNENRKIELFWAEKFRIKNDKIPNFWSSETVEKVLVSGKTAYFLKIFCGKFDWQASCCNFSFEFEGGFGGFEKWVETIHKETNFKAMSILLEDFHFSEELKLLKNYLLMCDGYFADFLLNDLKEELKKPCNQIYRHTMMGILEKTLKKTVQNTEIRQKLLERLSIIYIKRSSIIDIGWDLFSLDLSFKDPISQIILESDRNVYTKIFNFLVKVKRFQLEIQEIWQKTLVVMKLMRRKGFAFEKSKEKECLKMFKQAEITRNLIGFFLNNFLEFLLIEGIESEWNTFENIDLKACKSIGEIIQIHRDFLNRLQKKFMTLPEHQHLLMNILQLFEHIKAFTIINQSILDDFQEFLLKKKKENALKSLQELMEEESEFNFSENFAEVDYDMQELEGKLKFPKSIMEIKKEFERTLTEFLILLDKHQFKTTLAFKLNYNEFLEIRKMDMLFEKKPIFFNYEDLNNVLSPVKPKIKKTLEKRRSSPDVKQIFNRAFEDDEDDKVRKFSIREGEKYINVFNDEDI